MRRSGWCCSQSAGMPLSLPPSLLPTSLFVGAFSSLCPEPFTLCLTVLTTWGQVVKQVGSQLGGRPQEAQRVAQSPELSAPNSHSEQTQEQGSLHGRSFLRDRKGRWCGGGQCQSSGSTALKISQVSEGRGQRPHKSSPQGDSLPPSRPRFSPPHFLLKCSSICSPIKGPFILVCPRGT